ncbi:winged helix-turn-helix transcriptional regulator [Acetobacteraceae bacterium]|nr:winged helix-turn-helix transcriptional regulator [Candidatus Parcubacteria bacterium]
MHTKDKKLERVLKALGNARRLVIIRFLKNKKRASVGRIAEELNISFKATSKHLALLTSTEILTKEQRRNYMIFELHPEVPEAAVSIIRLL